MSIFSTLSTAASGLRSASTGINVTSHNVSNAAVDGYSRRDVRLVTADPVDHMGIGIGRGSRATNVARMSNFLINQRLVGATGREAEADSRRLSLSALEANFDEYGQEGPASLLNVFFDSVNALTRDPSNVAYRDQVVNDAVRFTDSVNRMADDVQRFRDDIYTELEDTIAAIQEKLDLVAEFNARVVASSSDLGSGDFQDQRDQLISEVAQSVGGSVRFSGDGLAQFFIGGHAVVTGPEARTLTVTQDAAGDPQVNLETGSATVDVTASIGGMLGGRLASDTEAAGYLADLNTFAGDLATAFNAQHALGFDTTGAAGGDFFNVTVGFEASTFTVDPLVEADSNLIAAAAAATAAAGDGDNLFQLSAIENSNLFSAGTENPTEFLAGIYSDVGRAAATAQLDYDAARYALEDLTALRDSVSGVDLDEEATKLLGWQAAYEASSRVVSTANAILGELMEMVR